MTRNQDGPIEAAMKALGSFLWLGNNLRNSGTDTFRDLYRAALSDAETAYEATHAAKREFRVAWKRDGWRCKSTTFQTRIAAERRAERIRTGDPHWRCDEGHGYYTSDGPDQEWVATCMPELVEGPTVEERVVGPWGTPA